MRLNLVEGYSAGRTLHQACREFGVPGNVRAIDDDVWVGPLLDDVSRNAWWGDVRANFVEGYVPPETDTNLYAQWNALRGSLAADSVSELVIWVSRTASDFVFLRMAASELKNFVGDMSLIDIPMENGMAGVGNRGAEALASFEAICRRVQTGEWLEMARVFDQEIPKEHGVRFLRDNNEIELRPYATFDELLLNQCPSEWTKWYKVIGHSMAASFGQNPVDSVFLSWRLRQLIESGVIENQGEIRETGAGTDILVRRVSRPPE